MASRHNRFCSAATLASRAMFCLVRQALSFSCDFWNSLQTHLVNWKTAIAASTKHATITPTSGNCAHAQRMESLLRLHPCRYVWKIFEDRLFNGCIQQV